MKAETRWLLSGYATMAFEASALLAALVGLGWLLRLSGPDLLSSGTRPDTAPTAEVR